MCHPFCLSFSVCPPPHTHMKIGKEKEKWGVIEKEAEVNLWASTGVYICAHMTGMYICEHMTGMYICAHMTGEYICAHKPNSFGHKIYKCRVELLAGDKAYSFRKTPTRERKHHHHHE